MPRLDHCHAQVVHALEKDGWTVASIPLKIETPDRAIFIDVQASRGINGNRQGIMLAEIKCFPDRDSMTTELYVAVGQYIIYRAILKATGDDRPLYLAVPDVIYDNVFEPAVRQELSSIKIKLLIVNLEMETIVQWIE